MYLCMAEKANRLLHKYRIRNFPIPLDAIENIVCSEGLDIQVTKCLSRAAFCGDVIYIGSALENSCLREYLVHEAAHSYHAGNTALQDPVAVGKNEGQAQAFAAYFLMPVGIFEVQLAQGESDYALGGVFGVGLELVQYRKALAKALWEGGNYERYKFFLP